MSKLTTVLFAATVLIVAHSCATSTVQRGLHSDIADIWLPRGATLDPYSNSKLEMWHANASLDWTTQAMNSLLPVNQPLDGLPWCGSTTAGRRAPTGRGVLRVGYFD